MWFWFPHIERTTVFRNLHISHEQNICSFYELRLCNALINILERCDVRAICLLDLHIYKQQKSLKKNAAISLNLLIFPLEQFFYKICYWTPCLRPCITNIWIMLPSFSNLRRMVIFCNLNISPLKTSFFKSTYNSPERTRY